jgi:hypothetical protein
MRLSNNPESLGEQTPETFSALARHLNGRLDAIRIKVEHSKLRERLIAWGNREPESLVEAD